MRPGLWLRYAARELRSGLSGFWIFLICLFLGTASIAITGSLSAAVSRGLSEQGQVILGGDMEFSLLHREMTGDERAFASSLGETSSIASLRAMATASNATTLVEVKAVDAAYPMFGSVKLDGAAALPAAIAPHGAGFGGVVDPILLGRLNLKPGDTFKLGTVSITIAATITSESDRLSQGFLLGPRLIISREALSASGLVQPGSLVTYQTRVRFPTANPPTLASVTDRAEKEFPNAGWRIKTRERAAQGTENFINNLSSFLTLVGLTSLIIGGAGIANAISSFIERRTLTIATLKCLGAPARDIFGIYMVEITLVALLAIAAALALGAATPAFVYAFLQGLLPVPVTPRTEWLPLLQAGIMSLLVTFAFSIWPTARTEHIAPSNLFRSKLAAVTGRPSLPYMVATALCLLGLGLMALASFENKRITLYYLGGLIASFIVLSLLAQAIILLAERLPRPKSAMWRHAIASLHRPGAATRSVILALGLGLTLLVSLSLTDRSLTSELRSGLPERAPAFFFLDVPNTALADFSTALKAQPGVERLENAPMLRGRITKIGEQTAAEIRASGDSSWALRGDRGLTYAETLPEGSRLVEGEWWPANYDGPPLVSFVDEVAEGIGLKIGDTVTVNVLGREITARVANFRAVNWRSMGINFVMVFTPNTLKAAPHNHIVTVEMNGGDEAALLNNMARAYPQVSAIRIKEALATVSDLLGKMLAAVRGANILTLLTGILVLAGALATGLGQRTYESVILKTYGASRRQLMQSFIVEYAILGLCAALFGIVVGTLGAWFIVTWLLEMTFTPSFTTAALTAALAMLLTVAAGLMATWRALSAKPAPLLRNE
jgi:putative ABC transport system permease protein